MVQNFWSIHHQYGTFGLPDKFTWANSSGPHYESYQPLAAAHLEELKGVGLCVNKNCPVILEEWFGDESRRTRHQNFGVSIFRFRLASSLSACFFLMERYSCKPSLTIMANIQTTQPPQKSWYNISYDTLSKKNRLEKKHAECSLRWDFSNLLWSCFLLLSASASGSNWNAAPNLAWKHKGQGELSERDISDVAPAIDVSTTRCKLFILLLELISLASLDFWILNENRLNKRGNKHRTNEGSTLISLSI